jgi:putative membrane protein
MLANILAGLVALIHIYIVILEMFLWDTPRGRKAFGTTEAFAKESKVLAANQGLYNGFLAAGLIWGIYLGDAGDPVKIFFLLCVAVAGVYGAATVGVRILLIQTVPAVIALAAVWFT